MSFRTGRTGGFIGLALAVLAASPFPRGEAQAPSPSPMASPVSPAPPAAMGSPPAAGASGVRLADVSWISGRWLDDRHGNYSEEIWSGPAGGAMVGMWRLVTRGRVQLYELLSLSEEAGGVTLRLRHFDPQLLAREEKDRPVTLRLTRLEGARATFEGEGTDGPLRLTYHRTGARTLAVTLERAGTRQEFRFEKKDGGPAASPSPAPQP
jgi:hypothetical protein